MFKQTLQYIRQTQNFGLLALLAMSFSMFPFIGPVMLPAIFVTNLLYTLLNAHNFINARNKNLDKWLNLMASAVSAALVGTALALTAYTVGMTVAPWLFISSVLVGAAHQLISTVLNLYTAFEAPAGSEHRKHYLKKAFGQLVLGSLIVAAALGTTVLLFQVPIAFVTAAVSIAAILLATEAALLLVWKALPKGWQDSIKNLFSPPKKLVFANEASLVVTEEHGALPDTWQHYGRLFTRFDQCSALKTMANFEEAKNYLLDAIKLKIKSLSEKPASEMVRDKFELLNAVYNSLKDNIEIRPDIYKGYKLAFKNTLAEKGDVEELFDAALLLQTRYPKADDTNSSGVSIYTPT